MKKRILFTILIIISFRLLAQETIDTTSEKIKLERNSQLKKLNSKLKQNENEIANLTIELSSINEKRTKEKVEALEKLQIASDKRIKFLEESPKTRIGFNGQLAFTELLSVQRDIQPADLFLQSQKFFTQLGDIGNVQQYDSYKLWKVEYDKWYKRKKGRNDVIELVNNSINLVSDVSSKVPLYGSIVQTATTGITTLLSTFGKKEKLLSQKTPKMISLFNALSQFEQQKAIIDYEWKLINSNLEQLKGENRILLNKQLIYYNLDSTDYKTKYLNATLEKDRDKYKESCRKKIEKKLSSQTDDKWLGEVEIYMYKVQSLRMRFGQLTNRMLSNIKRYNELITIYSDNTKFPLEFTNKLDGVKNSLELVRSTFYKSFNPNKYIEDSAIMYIDQEN